MIIAPIAAPPLPLTVRRPRPAVASVATVTDGRGVLVDVSA